MSTETLTWFAAMDLDSPWRRLHWTLPTALLICAIAFIWFAYSMEHPSTPSPEPMPINAELIELPAPAQTETPQKPVTQPIVKPNKQPDLTPPIQTEQPSEPAPPTASPAPATPVAAPATPAVPAETRGVKSIFQPLPVIPDELRQDYMNVSATARFHIDVDGTTTVELIKPTQNPRLNRVLLETLRTWRFSPAMQDGKPVASVENRIIRINVR